MQRRQLSLTILPVADRDLKGLDILPVRSYVLKCWVATLPSLQARGRHLPGHLAPVYLHLDAGHTEIRPNYWSDRSDGSLPALEFNSFRIGGVVWEAVSVVMIQKLPFEVWFLKDHPTPVVNHKACWFVVEVELSEVGTLVRQMNTFSLWHL